MRLKDMGKAADKTAGKMKKAEVKMNEILRKHPKLAETVRFISGLFTDDLPGIAASTAFFLLLSVFPLVLIVASSLRQYSKGFDRELIGYLLPASVADLIFEVIAAVPVLEGAALITAVIAVWSASEGIWALMKGICRAYTGKNPPDPILHRLIAFLFVLVFAAMIAFGLTVWYVGESLLSSADGLLTVAVLTAKYSIAFIGIFFFLLALYFYTPGYDIPFRKMLPGAALASIGWLLVSAGFEIYIKRFSNYSALYGSFGAFLGLTLWLFLICIVILLGAEVNAAILHRRKR